MRLYYKGKVLWLEFNALFNEPWEFASYGRGSDEFYIQRTLFDSAYTRKPFSTLPSPVILEWSKMFDKIFLKSCKREKGFSIWIFCIQNLNHFPRSQDYSPKSSILFRVQVCSIIQFTASGTPSLLVPYPQDISLRQLKKSRPSLPYLLSRQSFRHH